MESPVFNSTNMMGIILIYAIVISLVGLIFKWVWNETVTKIFNLVKIKYYQSFLIVLIIFILRLLLIN